MKAIILNASAWMIVPIMDAFAKHLSASMDVFQIVWARYFFSAFFTLSLMLIFYRETLVWSKNPKLQLIRGFVLAFSTLCFFYAISIISLPKALTLAFVAPITCTAFSPIFLNEKVGIRRWSAVIVGFLGALINGYTPDPRTNRPIYYDCADYDVFWKGVEQLGVPIYLHPRVPPNDFPDSIYHHYPEIQGSEWGFHVETGEHVLRLILSGLFDAYPKLKLVIGHMGEMLVFWVRRLDHRLIREGWHVNPSQHARQRAYTVEHYLKHHFHVTTSGYFCDASLRHVIDVMGIDRVCFSIDYPYENSRLACDWLDHVKLPEADKHKIAYGNAEKLFNI